MNKHKIITVITKEEPNHYQEIRNMQAENEKQAITIAKDWATKFPNEYVYILHTRKDNDQKGYINPDGYSLTGQDWAALGK